MTPRTILLFTRAVYELIRFDVLYGCCARTDVVRHLNVTNRRVRDVAIEREIADALALAMCLYWRPVLCLQRSIAGARLLRAYGSPARLVVGYRPLPFLAHAWVEVDGRVFSDSPQYPRQLRVLLTA
jgi:hypothetical protein